MASNLARRDGTIPQVHILQIDDDFEHTSGSHGNVSFEIHAQGDLRPASGGKRRKRQNGSGFETQSVSISNTFSLFNDVLTCPSAFGGSGTQISMLSGEINLDSTFTITVNMISRGTVSPPSVTVLTFSAPTTANLQGFVATLVSLQGTVSVHGLDLMIMDFPTFNIQGILSISPTFLAEASVSGLVQLQTLFDTDVNFNIAISNLQFSFPSNSPPATVTVTPSSAPFSVSILPNENSNAQLGVTAIFELLVDVSAFSEDVQLSVTHSLGYTIEMQATPSDTGNNEDVCVDVIQTFSLQVANGGPFFQALGFANTQTIFEEGNTVLSNCQTVALGPSPPNTRREMSLLSRDSVTFPPVAALPQGFIVLQGSFP